MIVLKSKEVSQIALKEQDRIADIIKCFYEDNKATLCLMTMSSIKKEISKLLEENKSKEIEYDEYRVYSVTNNGYICDSKISYHDKNMSIDYGLFTKHKRMLVYKIDVSFRCSENKYDSCTEVIVEVDTTLKHLKRTGLHNVEKIDAL